MDCEKMLYAIGEVDEDILFFKYHLKNVLWALLMGLVTVVTCMWIAKKSGPWIQLICLVALPLLFAGRVRWRYTWVNLVLYFPMGFLAGPWPAMYIGIGDGILEIPWIVYPFVTMFLFWVVQSMVYLVFNSVVWLYYFFRELTDKSSFSERSV